MVGPQSNQAVALLPTFPIIHHPQVGINPLVDAASQLFSLLSKLKYSDMQLSLSSLQETLAQQLTTFAETITQYDYTPDYIMICRYILCATFDDIIMHAPWGATQWDKYALLTTCQQEQPQLNKFFLILERAVAEPTLYIDLMELIYLCLSLGYKGQYRSSEHNQYQLEQVTHQLYKHIQVQRGPLHKTLSPPTLKSSGFTQEVSQQKTSLFFVGCVTACVIMTIFISLSYIMDIITNETYNNILAAKEPVSHETTNLVV
jgi:type VI secretion system protein ImpK